MIADNFDVENGQFFFPQMLSNKQCIKSPQKNNQNLKNLSQEFDTTLSIIAKEKPYIEELFQSQQPSHSNINESNSSEAIKDKRNSQNSNRTIIRRIKLFRNKKYLLKSSQQKKLYENDPRYLLAIFKHQAENGNMRDIQKFIKQSFSGKLIEIKESQELKDKKLNMFLHFFLTLQENDVSNNNIVKTLKRLSTTGQVKSHPPNVSKFTLPQFDKVMEFINTKTN